MILFVFCFLFVLVTLTHLCFCPWVTEVGGGWWDMHNLCSYLTLISWQCGANGLCQSHYCTRLSEHQSNKLHWTHTDTVRSENLQDYNNWHVPDSCSCKTTEESSTLMQMTWKMQELSRLMPALSHGCDVGGACNRNISMSLNLVDVWPTKIFDTDVFPMYGTCNFVFLTILNPIGLAK